MEHIVAWVPEDKKEELIKENEKFNIPLIFVNSISEIEKNLDGFAIFDPPLAVNDKYFISLIKKYPTGTFHAIGDIYAFDYETTMMLIAFKNILPDNPNTAEKLFERYLKVKKR